MNVNDYIMETERFVLRPLDEDDLESIAAILSEPEVVKTLVGDGSTPDSVRRLAAEWIVDSDFWEAHRFGYWGVIDRESSTVGSESLLGMVGADDPPPEVGEGPELYYFTALPAWGKGVATEAAKRIRDYLFQELHVPAVEALIFAEINPASVRVAENLGMQPIGRMNILGHHLTEELARETMEFDIWRVATAPAHRAKETLDHAAFRIGQLLGEGAWSYDEVVAHLVAACRKATTEMGNSDKEIMDGIEMSLAQGIEAAGVKHFRMRRDEYLARGNSVQ